MDKFYGTYKDYATGKYKVGEIPIIKETAKFFMVERVQAGGFHGRLDKERDGYFTQAVTPAIAIEKQREHLNWRIEQARRDLIKAEAELEQFERDIKEANS